MNSDQVLQLEQPLKDGGIRSVNFFNGRLLTSRDLSREQSARRESDWRLGLAVGEGVAFGFDVARDELASATDDPVLRIRAGLAINRAGQMLRLPADASVALTRRYDVASSDCTFTDCTPIKAGKYISGAGVYVLSVAPADAIEGRAQSNGLDPTNVRCNTDTTIEALRFRLHGFRPQDYASYGLGETWFRNALAYGCFGADVQTRWLTGLLADDARAEGLVGKLRGTTLTDYDVPLALIYVTGAATVQFIDTWAVRRVPTRPSASAWDSLVDERRPALGRAMLLQFEQQIMESAPPTGDLGSLTARGDFRYLPAAGVMPVPEETTDTDAAATRFFAGMTYRGPTFINGAQVEPLLRESLCYPPIDTQGAELIWLYRVRENRFAIDYPLTGNKPGSWLVFASGHMPYRGDARFDLAYADYANFALGR